MQLSNAADLASLTSLADGKYELVASNPATGESLTLPFTAMANQVKFPGKEPQALEAFKATLAAALAAGGKVIIQAATGGTGTIVLVAVAAAAGVGLYLATRKAKNPRRRRR